MNQVEIVRLLDALRMRTGLKQKDVPAAIGISSRTYRSTRANTTRASVETMFKIYNYLKANGVELPPITLEDLNSVA